MAKSGIINDYDLMANAETSAQDQTCVVCDASPMTFQWSDYSGEAMCTQCGCPYQLKWGSDEQQIEKKYPYINLLPEFVPIAKEYWNEKHQWVCYGMMLGPRPGIETLNKWIQVKHPEIIVKETESTDENQKAR